MATRIPEDQKPNAIQYPPFVTTEEQRDRYDVCFALTRMIAQNDDPVFCRQLYFSDMPTGDLGQVQEALEDGS